MSWNADIASAFEARLARARLTNRPQYLRIQATHLLESVNANNRIVGRQLLRRVITEFPENFQVKSAWEQLGRSLAEESRLDDSVEAFRKALLVCSESPTGNSGTSATIELQLAEVLIERAGPGDLEESTLLLDIAAKDRQLLKQFRNVAFRYQLARTRIAKRSADPAAPKLARSALQIAAETAPTFSRHPSVGRPDAAQAEIEELRRIASKH